MEKLTQQDFISKASQIHNGFYDYSKAHYSGNKLNISIICPTHGIFDQLAGNHLAGHGCQECKNYKLQSDRIKPAEVFIEECKLIHDNKYDYSKIIYLGAINKITIICPKHDEFEQKPESSLEGSWLSTMPSFNF